MSHDKTVTMPLELAESLLSWLLMQQHYRVSDVEQLRALLAAPAVERQGEQQMACMPIERCYDVRAKMIIAFNEARKSGGDLDDGLDAAYKAALRYSPHPLAASPPAPVAVMHPFADKVIRKLQRFHECMDDGQGADIGRHWFDLLTQLGLLNRVRRSPALWEISQQGEDCLDKVKEMNP